MTFSRRSQASGRTNSRSFCKGFSIRKPISFPKIGALLAGQEFDVLFLSGVGEVYPYIRSHNVLNNLQSTAKEKPTVMFFPGKYTHSLATGASLDLFGILHDDKYYRAFDITHYEI